MESSSDNPHLQLAKKYPNILMRSNWTGKLLEDQIGCELSIGYGWLQLVDDLCGKLQQAIQSLSEEQRKGFFATQVKQKFGGLRFYVSYGNDEIYKLISEAENQSYKTCEVCGEPGESTNDGWVMTLCKEHLEK